jgi:hypothetical protein
MMTLYLSPELTPQEIRKAKEAGIVGHWFILPLIDRNDPKPSSNKLQVSNHIRGV